MKKIRIAMILILCLLSSAALADTISLNGKVEASETWLVYAPVGGTVWKLARAAGKDTVKKPRAAKPKK